MSHLTLPRPPVPQEHRYAGGQHDVRQVIAFSQDRQEGWMRWPVAGAGRHRTPENRKDPLA
ncbi:MAG: hypothetical protein OXH93_13190 [Caldilineaceae bacterium]|nr:hypothetical protein [Caldilineaceae bacterium]